MVRSAKKAVSITFCVIMIFAVCALCAPGVYADTVEEPLFVNNNFGIQDYYGTTTGELPLNRSRTSGSYRTFLSFNTPNFSDSSALVGHTLYFDLTFNFSTPSNWDPLNYTFYLNNTSTTIPWSNFVIQPITTGWRITFSCELTSAAPRLRVVMSPGLNPYNCTLTSFDVFVDSIPGQEPEPDPSTDYTPVDTSVYFSNSKRSDLSVWNYNNTVSDSLPFREYVNQSQPWDYYCGALISNWSDIFRPYTVLQGEVTIAAVDLTVIADVPDASFSTGSCYFVSNTQPSSSDFQYQAVPSTWESEVYSYRTTLNNYGYAYTISFYIVIPDTYLSDLNFTPVDLVFLFGNFHPASGGRYAVVFSKYNFNYYFYGSSSSAEIPPNPDNGIPDSAVEPTPITEVSEQTEWLTQQYFAGDDEYDAIIDDVTDSSRYVNFELYGDALSHLSQMLTSTSMQFDFKLPAAFIPAISDKVPRIDLWDDTKSIPFKFYIDSLPVQYKKIIGFIVLLSAASAIIGSYGLFFRRLLRKDVST